MHVPAGPRRGMNRTPRGFELIARGRTREPVLVQEGMEMAEQGYRGARVSELARPNKQYSGDRVCAAEGCERPFAWCDIHHPHAWSQGGATDLGNGIPLCGWHHRRAHDARYDLTRLASGEVRYRRRR